MRQIVFAAAAALGIATVAAPAQASLFQWNVDYTGFFAEDATINGFFRADETAAADGIVFADEFTSWEWNWSGNSEVEAFSVSSANGEFATLFDTPGFFVDGTPNELELVDGLDQGSYTSDSFGLDLEFLFVESFTTGGVTPFPGTTTFGDATAGTVAVADPVPVPEPARLLGLLTLAGATAVVQRQKRAA